jgi:hypothetical protein
VDQPDLLPLLLLPVPLLLLLPPLLLLVLLLLLLLLLLRPPLRFGVVEQSPCVTSLRGSWRDSAEASSPLTRDYPALGAGINRISPWAGTNARLALIPPGTH